MFVKALRCPVCGAPVSREKSVCDYCHTHYVIENEKAVLIGDYGVCNIFKEIIKKYEYKNLEKVESVPDEFYPYCKRCHIKNCPFFGKPNDIDYLCDRLP